MKVVVTGAAGMIGSNIVHGLNAVGIDNVIAVDDLTDGPKYRNLLGAQLSDYFDRSEFYVRFAKAVTPDEVGEVLKGRGIKYALINQFGRTEDNQLEVVLVGLNTEVTSVLNAKLGEGAVKAIPSADSVGAKAGKELRDDGIKSLLAAIKSDPKKYLNVKVSIF